MKEDRRVIRGTRASGEPVVTIGGVTLTPDASLEIRNHSPDGFEWGYGGSGPSQLALAILMAVTGDHVTALRYYHDFKCDHVAHFAPDEFALPVRTVKDWVQARQRHD